MARAVYAGGIGPGQRGIDVQHEGIGIGPEFGHDEGGPMLHQPADEMNVAVGA
jgi:hypothetical protein